MTSLHLGTVSDEVLTEGYSNRSLGGLGIKLPLIQRGNEHSGGRKSSHGTAELGQDLNLRCLTLQLIRHFAIYRVSMRLRRPLDGREVYKPRMTCSVVEKLPSTQLHLYTTPHSIVSSKQPNTITMHFTLATLIPLIAAVSAQSWSDIPACAQPCILEAAAATTACGATDYACICTLYPIHSSLTKIPFV